MINRKIIPIFALAASLGGGVSVGYGLSYTDYTLNADGSYTATTVDVTDIITGSGDTQRKLSSVYIQHTIWKIQL